MTESRCPCLHHTIGIIGSRLSHYYAHRRRHHQCKTTEDEDSTSGRRISKKMNCNGEIRIRKRRTRARPQNLIQINDTITTNTTTTTTTFTNNNDIDIDIDRRAATSHRTLDFILMRKRKNLSSSLLLEASLLFIICLLVPLASSFQTPPSSQTIEGE